MHHMLLMQTWGALQSITHWQVPSGPISTGASMPARCEHGLNWLAIAHYEDSGPKASELQGCSTKGALHDAQMQLDS